MIEELNEFLNGEPFVPFRIVLTSGEFYEVVSPYQISQKPANLTYYYYGVDGFAVLRLNQIAALETLGPRWSTRRKSRK